MHIKGLVIFNSSSIKHTSQVMYSSTQLSGDRAFEEFFSEGQYCILQKEFMDVSMLAHTGV